MAKLTVPVVVNWDDIEEHLMDMLEKGEIQRVKRGRWEYTDYGGVGNWHCSECHNIVAGMNGFPNLTQYCPNCGAKMDEVKK